jgi:penicillin-binding protein 2
MAEWLEIFGFGQRTGLDLKYESSGLIGTPEWSRTVRGTPWYPGEAVSVSIGQGPLLVTVVQLARAYATLANGGIQVTPHLTSPPDETAPNPGINRGDLALVTSALEQVVHGASGTARRVAYLPIAGKTGTAQVARLQDGVKPDELAPELQHHAWFAGWAPLDEPELAIAVIVEHGGGGGSAAAPVAGKVIEAYLQRKESPEANPPKPPPVKTPDSPHSSAEAG